MIRLVYIPATALLMVCSASADTVVATSTLQPGQVLTHAHVAIVDTFIPGALTEIVSAVGLEANTVLYTGRPIRAQDLTQPAVIHRNQLVELLFVVGGISIATEGRALDRAAEGQKIRVMNLASRTTVSGRARRDGSVQVYD